MDKVKQEIARTDPDVAFRASSSHIHHTWARTFQSRPELYIRPQSLDEVQKVVTLARRCRRRLVVVGSGHSPSDLTCTSSWMVNLDDYGRLLHVDRARRTFLVEAGMRLHDLNQEAHKHGLSMPNLGSIDAQSIAGAIATATHGSSLRHGIISESVLSLRIVLSNGSAVRCSRDQNTELFRAALVSLGALGIIVEVEFQMVDNYKVEWEQKLVTLDDVLTRWNTTLWTREFTRVWWMPYMKRAIVWSAERTDRRLRAPAETWYGGAVGFHTYHNLLWLSNYIPWILPAVEWFVFGMQYGFSPGTATTAVEGLSDALLMNCLYSQFVNEWALPLHKGPEAITRLSAWLNREPGGGGIPFSARGLYVHCPIEVRVSDSTVKGTRPRPYLDNTCADGPTLYLNATLYRAYLADPPCRERYYEAFEWLMREMGARPHYAKNFTYTSSEYVQSALGDDLKQWVKVRNEADPEGMFLGAWHRRTLGAALPPELALEEAEVQRRKASDGGQLWTGEIDAARSQTLAFAAVAAREQVLSAAAGGGGGGGAEVSGSPTPSSSAESFDMMHSAEAEKSVLFNGDEEEEDDDGHEEGEGDDGTEVGARYHANAKDTVTGTAVFDKM